MSVGGDLASRIDRDRIVVSPVLPVDVIVTKPVKVKLREGEKVSRRGQRAPADLQQVLKWRQGWCSHANGVMCES